MKLTCILLLLVCTTGAVVRPGARVPIKRVLQRQPSDGMKVLSLLASLTLLAGPPLTAYPAQAIAETAPASTIPAPAQAPASTTPAETGNALPQQMVRGFQTKSGLKYFEMAEGTGTSPRYGQLVAFHYTGYYRATPGSPLDSFDTAFATGKGEVFLHKHGNGRLVRGLDEGLHTMKVGGKRRLVVPKSIGYTELGLGPVPMDPGQRRKLGGLLDELLQDRGELIFDVELVLVADDENDQGYYDDEPVSQEEVRQLVLKSLNTNANNPELMDKMFQTTPETLFKK